MTYEQFYFWLKGYIRSTTIREHDDMEDIIKQMEEIDTTFTVSVSSQWEAPKKHTCVNNGLSSCKICEQNMKPS